MTEGVKTIGMDEFHTMLKAQGVARIDLAFKCPICGTIQSAQDLINAGAGATFEDVEQCIAFSCVGRFTGAGPHKKGAGAGMGCDWTLGGLFRLHKMEVIDREGKPHPIFEIATAEEAKSNALAANVLARTAAAANS